jgi:hypothetical protein
MSTGASVEELREHDGRATAASRKRPSAERRSRYAIRECMVLSLAEVSLSYRPGMVLASIASLSGSAGNGESVLN